VIVWECPLLSKEALTVKRSPHSFPEGGKERREVGIGRKELRVRAGMQTWLLQTSANGSFEKRGSHIEVITTNSRSGDWEKAGCVKGSLSYEGSKRDKRGSHHCKSISKGLRGEKGRSRRRVNPEGGEREEGNGHKQGIENMRFTILKGRWPFILKTSRILRSGKGTTKLGRRYLSSSEMRGMKKQTCLLSLNTSKNGSVANAIRKKEGGDHVTMAGAGLPEGGEQRKVFLNITSHIKNQKPS